MNKMYKIEALPPRLVIGRQTETGVEMVQFDCTAWLSVWPDMEISVWPVRPGDIAAYPAVIERAGNIITWTITDVDTAVDGEGNVEVMGMADGKRKLSARAVTHILASGLGNTQERPEGARPWVDEVLDAARRAENAAEVSAHPPIIGENGNWWLWDGGAYVDSGKPSQGAGGGSSVAVDTTLTVPGAAADAAMVGKRVNELSEEIANQRNEKPLVYIDGEIPVSKDNVFATLTVKSNWLNISAYIKIKCQGTSSMAYPKKNFTVALYQDAARTIPMEITIPGWKHASNKFVLKANYIDHLHARNIVSARLWSEIVASRPDYDTLPKELRNSPNNGAVDGFPIIVYTNGKYQGLYTWNIGKDAWMWGMNEDNPNHVLMCAETNDHGLEEDTDNPCNFRALWSGVHEENWSVEVGEEGDATTNALNALIGCVMNTTDEDFRNQIGTYLDVQSAIDYYIFAYADCGIDSLAKNMLLGTFDLRKWYAGAYDLDSTWGLYWDGSKFIPATTACPDNYQNTNSLLWEKINRVFEEEIKERKAALRATVLSDANILTHFERFAAEIGAEAYADDLVPYPSIPSAESNNIWQLRNFIADRMMHFDTWLADTLLYALPEATVFSGNVSDAINTGVNLWRKDIDFTIALDLQPGTQVGDRATVFTCCDQLYPYNGILMEGNKPVYNSYFVRVDGVTHKDTAIYMLPDSSNRFCVIVRHVAGSDTYTLTVREPSGKITNYPVDIEYQNANEAVASLWIGTDFNYGEAINPWVGTLYRFEVHSRSMTDDEVTAFFAGMN